MRAFHMEKFVKHALCKKPSMLHARERVRCLLSERFVVQMSHMNSDFHKVGKDLGIGYVLKKPERPSVQTDSQISRSVGRQM